jgi:hypothetical protein
MPNDRRPFPTTEAVIAPVEDPAKSRLGRFLTRVREKFLGKSSLEYLKATTGSDEYYVQAIDALRARSQHPAVDFNPELPPAPQGEDLQPRPTPKPDATNPYEPLYPLNVFLPAFNRDPRPKAKAG